MWAIAILLIVLGISIKYGKMYNLLAGYNTMSAQEKAKVNITAVATLFRNVMFFMAATLIAADIFIYYANTPNMEDSLSLCIITTGVLYFIIRGNTKKYRLYNNK
ncbi:DUF3784 domain-containing protein [Flavobacterium subsaxonicum]|uniref:DUF3784 domain-containing protein n=1 Tax=Flavobacterium subsaxonicum WB 4.1-42 = DSM 21790 TaxID=1121898 RepID=A0A0A2MP99_9FLAO|nr:DUF3784 domain-containing protein [Flavobacterium subsaxonicum]KGO93411.1 hypothetical protein Q766_08945 [Flavobacterium subsaxonicum WB 4.1-42 = DSM 21790]